MAARRTTGRGRERGREGHALLIALIAVLAMTAIAGAILATSAASKAEVEGAIARTHALYAAEAGISQAAVNLSGGQPAAMGSEGAPNVFSDGAYWGSAILNPDETYTVTSVGESRGATRAVQAMLRPGSRGALWNAVFAGNQSGAAGYDLHFSGGLLGSDAIVGDIYSGGSLSFAGSSTIDGTPRAQGSVSTQAGTIQGSPPPQAETGVDLPLPDLAGMNYPVNNDIDVSAAFVGAPWVFRLLGISAFELPDSHPAHIFRMNPSDRTALTLLTPKQDYFLEDPYQPMILDPLGDVLTDGSIRTRIRLCDTVPAGSTDTADGNNKVYYIDGNLWLESLITNAFELYYPEASGCQVTFVVKGNIYFGDNLYLHDPVKDGVAFIALKDAAVPDSGNIYFSNLIVDKVNEMNAVMITENDFYGNILDMAGLIQVAINGSVIALNQVAMNADWGAIHTKLDVTLDQRIASGAVVLPGLPAGSTVNPVYSIALWREVAAP